MDKEYKENEDLHDDQQAHDAGFEMTLEDFLSEHIVEGATEEIILCERLKGYKFKIGSMTKKEHENYLKSCIVRGKGGRVLSQNNNLFNELVVLNHCIYPNFKNIEFLKKLNTATPSEALSKVLKTGEITILASKILKFNGFEDEEDEREKVKN